MSLEVAVSFRLLKRKAYTIRVTKTQYPLMYGLLRQISVIIHVRSKFVSPKCCVLKLSAYFNTLKNNDLIQMYVTLCSVLCHTLACQMKLNKCLSMLIYLNKNTTLFGTTSLLDLETITDKTE